MTRNTVKKIIVEMQLPEMTSAIVKKKFTYLEIVNKVK